MPRFPWLIANKLDRSEMISKMELMKNTFDVPYTKAEIDSANQWANNQSRAIVKRIYSEATDVKDQVQKDKMTKGSAFIPLEQREIIAMIAYLQRLGTDIKTTDIKTASVD
jgi:cytochrome c oxidase cbb3-type subunit I/II